MQRLEAPAAGDEFGRQPVQQLRMRRRIRADSKISGSRDETRSEMMRPDAIHHDPRGQWIGGINDGLRHFQPPAAVFKGFAIRSGQQREKLTRNIVALVRRVASFEDSRIRRRLAIFNDRGKTRFGIGINDEAIHFAPQFPQFRAGALIKVVFRMHDGFIRDFTE